jgi:hypothetical protein
MSDEPNKEPSDELAALKARVEELERKNKPPEPFKPEPYQRYDPTANMSMPPGALREMIAAEPAGFMKAVVGDNRAPSGRAGAIPTSQRQVSSERPGGAAGDGTGWSRSIPIGPSMHARYVDAQIDAQDQKDRRELIEQKAREQALLKAAEGK